MNGIGSYWKRNNETTNPINKTKVKNNSIIKGDLQIKKMLPPKTIKDPLLLDNMADSFFLMH